MPRITSYNVCYTKLLREDSRTHRGQEQLIKQYGIKPLCQFGNRGFSIFGGKQHGCYQLVPGAYDENPPYAAGKLNRITSYNVCYTKLLRVRFVGVGEGIDDLQAFDPELFAEALLAIDAD